MRKKLSCKRYGRNISAKESKKRRRREKRKETRVSQKKMYESTISLITYVHLNKLFHSQVAEIVRECIKPLKDELQSVKETVISFRTSDADTSATSEKLP